MWEIRNCAWYWGPPKKKLAARELAQKLPGNKDDLRLVGRLRFDTVSPLSAELDSRFTGLYPSIHGQHSAVSEIVGDILLKRPQDVVVESPRGQGQF